MGRGALPLRAWFLRRAAMLVRWDRRSQAKGKGRRLEGRRRVEEMLEWLSLTATEANPVILDDEDEVDLVAPDCALVGKALSPNTLHIHTISSVMRPAWGNPKGLLFHPAGDYLFVAEFGTEADRARVVEVSPWMVGKHAVLLKVFDLNVQPLQIQFDRLAIWA